MTNEVYDETIHDVMRIEAKKDRIIECLMDNGFTYEQAIKKLKELKEK